MGKMRAVDAAVHALEREGATTTSGVPGGAISPLHAAIRPWNITQHVLAGHVEGAAHMAEGYTCARARAGNIGKTTSSYPRPPARWPSRRAPKKRRGSCAMVEMPLWSPGPTRWGCCGQSPTPGSGNVPQGRERPPPRLPSSRASRGRDFELRGSGAGCTPANRLRCCEMIAGRRARLLRLAKAGLTLEEG